MSEALAVALTQDEWPDEANSWLHCGAKYVNPVVDATCGLEPGHDGAHIWWWGNQGLAWNKSGAWGVWR